MNCFCRCHITNIGGKCINCKCDSNLICPRCNKNNIVDGSDDGFYGDRKCLDCKYLDERLQFESIPTVQQEGNVKQ
jgi:hypothetical protein